MEILPILSSLRRHKITAFLLVLEIALTCAIICNAVFLISQRLERMSLPSGIAEHELIQIKLADVGVRTDARARTEADLAALRRIAGVSQVGVASQLPFGQDESNTDITLSPTQRQASMSAAMFFGQNLQQTLGIRLVAGRSLNEDDSRDYKEVMKAAASGDTSDKALPRVVVITQAMADKLWPGQSALNKVIYLKTMPLTVVGVVEHLARASNLMLGIDDSILMPISMRAGGDASFLIRTKPEDRERVLRASLKALNTLDPRRVVLEKRTYDDVRRAFFREDRAMSWLLVGVCVALLIVTALGIVGLASFWVSQRRRTIGVRRALGATRSNILHYFQAENLVLATLGIGVGMVLAYGINLFLMLHYELPRLPLYYLPIGAMTLWLLGQLAVLGPALRAAAVPPVVATRSV
jgi:putative ABC transport system permease protein